MLAAIPPGGDVQGTVTVAGRSIRYVARTTAQGRIVLTRAASLAFAEWRPFLQSLVLAGFGGALLAAVCSYLLARRLTRPIGELSRPPSGWPPASAGSRCRSTGATSWPTSRAPSTRMSGELARAREAQRSFLESVSHELKTPLTSIRGYAEAVGEGAVQPAEGSAVISAEADRLERLVRDLLDLARFDRAEFSVATGGSISARSLRGAVQRHLPRARELSVSLSAVAEDGARALGDEDRLLQATSNLIENALRLTPAGGAVAVRAARGRLTVTDTGPGLAQEDLPRAFERFYLHERYRSERAVGSGLGLAIVGELARAMGATVSAANAPGGGAQFELALQQPPGDHQTPGISRLVSAS